MTFTYCAGGAAIIFPVTLEAADCTGQMKQGSKQGISLEMSPALSLNTEKQQTG